MSPIRNIVIGQHVSSTMWQTAQQLRREMTEEEKILWQKLRANRLGGFHFRRQQIIAKYVVDFYCHAALLIIEIDGEIHAQQVERDAERQSYLESCGFLVLRFKNRSLENELENVLKQILETCRARTS